MPEASNDDIPVVNGDISSFHSPSLDQKRAWNVDQFDNGWLNVQFHDESRSTVKRPHELELEMPRPPETYDKALIDRIAGSMLGMAIGDALGAHVEFRPRHYLLDHPVTDLSAGGTWGLDKGQFTDDTSMALCLANSLIASRGFNPYDQLVRYKWWYRHGYMSSTGECFDIGAATRQSIEEFERRQTEFAQLHGLIVDQMDDLREPKLLSLFNVNCSEDGVAGNGALMRLAPVPLFFHHHPPTAVDYAGQSAELTHGDQKAIDACRYYAALIVAALHGARKDELLANGFYEEHQEWFRNKELQVDILNISRGSYKKKGGYEEGIRGKGYVVPALEAALWAFWSTESFKDGALTAVNLGDDTDTTAAIYGQLAGVIYGRERLPQDWLSCLYGRPFITNLAEWIAYEGSQWYRNEQHPSVNIAATTLSASVPSETDGSDVPIEPSTGSVCDVLVQLLGASDPASPNSINVAAQRVQHWTRKLPRSMEMDWVEWVHHPARYRSFVERVNAIDGVQVSSTHSIDPSMIGISRYEQKKMSERLGRFKRAIALNQPEWIAVIRGWYGCHSDELKHIIEHGFPRKTQLDSGEAHQGFCFKGSAKAAAEQAGPSGCVLMCYLILRHPVPTIIDDHTSEMSNHPYRYYSGGIHNVFQRPEAMSSSLPYHEVYAGFYDEFVINDSNDILLQFVIHLSPSSSNAKAL